MAVAAANVTTRASGDSLGYEFMPLDPRIARSKAALREALIALMEERGLDGFTVGDLCTRAGLNRGTFYNHFKDKDNLLDTFEDEVMEGLEAFRVKMQELEIRDLLKYRARKRPLPVLVELFDYLREFYDVLHTTGYQYINNDIDIYLKSRNAVIPV